VALEDFKISRFQDVKISRFQLLYGAALFVDDSCAGFSLSEIRVRVRVRIRVRVSVFLE